MMTAWMPNSRQRTSGGRRRSQSNPGAGVRVLAKSPAPAHEPAARGERMASAWRGHGEGTDARVEATQERLPDARVEPTQERWPDGRHAPSAVGSPYSGYAPYALRASFAVRAAPAAPRAMLPWPHRDKVARAPQAHESSRSTAPISVKQHDSGAVAGLPDTTKRQNLHAPWTWELPRFRHARSTHGFFRLVTCGKRSRFVDHDVG